MSSASNAQKTPLARSLNRFVEQKVHSYMQTVGRTSLPASVTAVNGSIVTVSFQVTSPYTLPTVTVPIIGSEYIRLPIQVGCTGMVLQADAYLGGVTGLGGGMADLSIPANLSSLVFLPLGSKKFSTTDNPNAIVLYGPDGGILRTMDKTCSVNASSSGVAITVPAGKTVNISNLPVSSAGLISGDLWNDGDVVHVVP